MTLLVGRFGAVDDAQRVRNAVCDSLRERGPYAHWVTLTYRRRVDVSSAEADLTRYVRRLAQRAGRPVGAVGVVDRAPTSGRVHLHVALTGTAELPVNDVRGAWKGQGFTKGELYNPTEGGVGYLADRMLSGIGVPVYVGSVR